MISHKVEKITFKDSGISLEELNLVDYPDKRISDLSFDDIGTPEEPVEHRERLRASVVEDGFHYPVIGLQDNSGYWLIEGHHRITLAYEHGLESALNMYLIVCDCELNTSKKEYCAFVENFLREQFQQSALNGWNW